jgi:DGQHR domain-containing protein
LGSARRGIADCEKPGWIVDGQQRMAAIRDAAISSFPICVTAFVAEGEQEQKEQFILVNSTKPLPKGLIYELLPTTQMTLPSLLQRRFPAYLTTSLKVAAAAPQNALTVPSIASTSPEPVSVSLSTLRSEIP